MKNLRPEEFGEVVYKFKILYHEWECDGYGYVVKTDNGERQLVLSNHGTFYISKDAKEDLNERLQYYKEVVDETKKAFEFLQSE